MGQARDALVYFSLRLSPSGARSNRRLLRPSSAARGARSCLGSRPERPKLYRRGGVLLRSAAFGVRIPHELLPDRAGAEPPEPQRAGGPRLVAEILREGGEG